MANTNALLDDIDSLSRGGATRSRIGSRKVPHRLTPEEREQLSKAKRTGYLVALAHHRINLRNVYEKFCQTQGLPLVEVVEKRDGAAELFVQANENQMNAVASMYNAVQVPRGASCMLEPDAAEFRCSFDSLESAKKFAHAVAVVHESNEATEEFENVRRIFGSRKTEKRIG